MKISEKKPGIELDVEIADRFLGFHIWYDSEKDVWKCYDPKLPNHRVVLPRYSTNVDHVYRVINELHSKGYYVKVGSTVINNETVWRARLFKKQGNYEITVLGESLPHSVCLAALVLIEPKPKSSVDNATIINFPGQSGE